MIFRVRDEDVSEADLFGADGPLDMSSCHPAIKDISERVEGRQRPALGAIGPSRWGDK